MIEAADLHRLDPETRVVIDGCLERGLPVVDVSAAEIRVAVNLAACDAQPFIQTDTGDLVAVHAPSPGEGSEFLQALVRGYYSSLSAGHAVARLFVSPRAAMYLHSQAILGWSRSTLNYELRGQLIFLGMKVLVAVPDDLSF